MVSSRVSGLLSVANREVQAADHLLSVTYPMTKDPKLLLSVLWHCTNAIESAAQSMTESSDPVSTLANTNIPSAKKAQSLYNDLKELSEKYKASPTAFVRKEKFVIAGDEFSTLSELTAESLGESLKHIKLFVHEANRHAIVGGEQ